MKTQRTSLKKILALVLMLTMVMSMVMGAVAVRADGDTSIIDTSKTGSITVTKYATVNKGTTGTAAATTGAATGTANDAVTDTAYAPLKDAEFVLVKIADADAVVDFYNGTDESVMTIGTLTKSGDTWQYNGSDAVSYTGVTDENGVYTFSNLAVGFYVLHEITAPDQITTPLAEDSMISLPMVNTATSSNNDNAEWIYDINVYPKNHEATGSFELTKYGHTAANTTAALENVHFRLSKSELDETGALGDWETVTKTVADNGTETDLVLITGADGKISLAGLPAGKYGTQYKLEEYYCDGEDAAVCSTASPIGYIVNEKPMYFTVNIDNTMTWNAANDANCPNVNTAVQTSPVTATTAPAIAINLYNEKPSLTKFVNDNDGTATDNWVKYGDFGADEIIQYKLNVYVPMNASELATFKVVDTIPTGLTMDGDSTVKVGDAVVSADKWTRTNNGQAYTYIFTNGESTAWADIAGKEITIYYTVRMNESVVIAGNGNINTAVLTYSASIPDVSRAIPENYTIVDNADVYTYAFQITKHQDTATGTVMKDIEFQLLDKNKAVLNVIKEAEGVYRLCNAADEGKTTTLVTNESGVIVVKDLDPDTYYLKETKTAEGYNLLSAPVEFVVAPGRSNTWVTVEAWDGTEYTVSEHGAADTTYTNGKNYDTNNTNVINKKGFVLPQTGSMGYLLFCAAGIILVIGGAALLFSSRKRAIR